MCSVCLKAVLELNMSETQFDFEVAILGGGWSYEGRDYSGVPDVYASVNLGHLKRLKAAGRRVIRIKLSRLSELKNLI